MIRKTKLHILGVMKAILISLSNIAVYIDGYFVSSTCVAFLRVVVHPPVFRVCLCFGSHLLDSQFFIHCFLSFCSCSECTGEICKASKYWQQCHLGAIILLDG